MSPKPKPTHALVLSGGGSYAAYEVGVMKALFAGSAPSAGGLPVDPAIIAATSAGALNAAALLSSPHASSPAAADDLEKMWLDEIADNGAGNGVIRFRGDPLDLLEPERFRENPLMPIAQFAGDAVYYAGDLLQRGVNFFQSHAGLQQREVELVDLASFVSTQPFRDLVRKVVRPDQVRASGKALRIAATNWRTGVSRVFRESDMTEEQGHAIVLGSAAVIGIFPSAEIEGDPYVDGGVRMNTPLLPAIQAGADVLHAIYMDPEAARLPLPRLRNTLSTVYRLVVIMWAGIMRQDIERARRINVGLRLAERSATEPPPALELRSLISTLGGAAAQSGSASGYRRLTIHRYHPHDDPGGSFRWLSFDRDHIQKLIRMGFEDTLQHDCRANHCILPE